MRKIVSIIIFFISIYMYGSNDKYRLTLRGNPATSIVIGWDQTSGSNPVVHYGTTDYGRDYSRYSNTKSPDRSVLYRGMNNTFARISNLQPNTAYYFVIRDSQGTSQRFWFKTAPSDNSRLSFIAGGDSRNNRTPRRNANTLVAKLKPTAVLFGGDMTDDDTNSQWNSWFDDWQLTIASDGRMFPIIAARGNHEGSNRVIQNLFDTPSSNVYYAITFGNNLIRAYTLNTEMSISGDQTNWLQNDLAANTNVPWKMAQYHKPMRPHVSSKREGNNQYSNWARLFYDYQVQLVVECDAHTVKTTWPVRPSNSSGSDEGFVRDNDKGTVYVGEGCWGAPLRSNNDAKRWTRDSGRFNQFKWIFVDENKIETRTIRVDNASDVASVSNADVFSIPRNLDVWSPGNGSVVTITKNATDDDDQNQSSGTIDVSISSGADDVEEESDGTVYANSSDLELVYDDFNSSFQVIGLRFRSLRLPKNATITEAYLQFTADESDSESTSLEIALHNSSNSSAFSDANTPSGRTTFSSKVNWNPNSWTRNQSGSAQRSPNLKTMVQSLVNKSSWASGNNASFIIRGIGRSATNTAAKRVADSYEGGVEKAARLIVSYTTDDTPPPSDICAGISEWRSGVSYGVGEKVTYQGNLFIRTASGWDFLGECGTTNRLKNRVFESYAYPPLAKEEIFRIHPNPFSDKIMISGLQSVKENQYTVVIYDLSGKEIFSQMLDDSQMEIHPPVMQKGIYILTIKDRENIRILAKQIIKN